MNFYKTLTLLCKSSKYFPINLEPHRFRHTKHWNPKYKIDRKKKFMKVDFSEIEKVHGKISQNVRHTKMKEKGIFPQRPWLERPMYISCTGNTFEPYIPPEGDGKFSSISPLGAKQNVEFLMKKTKSIQAIKKIKRYEEEFNVTEFAKQVIDIYTKAHRALTRKHEVELTNYVTEKLFPEMLYNLKNKTITWVFIKSLEPAKVVHARCTSLLAENNLFAQVTVRLHTQQMLAVHDRFGRLISGSEIIKKDVLEYIVLEKHLSNEYGQWRLHSKIIPTWMPSKPCIKKTFVMDY